ncbi:MAG: peptidoglycan editing factor PgeF [Bacteroidaceae bacterium]|nr:peptidoglycan editing factor PgeF [Bacteroidaceae bacterium]
MSKNNLKYCIGVGVEAFSTERDAELPYYVVQPHQVHGCVIREVADPNTTREQLEGVDALVTNVPGVAISVRTADCIPVLLYDSTHKAIAAVHAGWRGTVQHISQKTIDSMHELYGTDAADLCAVIGPGIGPESFQVGQEVADAFADAGFPMGQILQDCGPKAPTVDNPMQGGLHIDLWKANQWLLEQAGVLPQNIQVAGICTYRNNDRFFSARREGTKCGRIINVIKIEN